MNMTKRKKKGLVAILSVMLVLVIAAGLTLAWLFNMTEEVENVFTFADNIRAELTEPSWDEENGKNLVPGAVIDKDPQITNTSKNAVDEYAAIKITFERGDGTILTEEETEKLLGLITIDWSSNWTLIGDGTSVSPEQIYRFNEILSPNVTSDPLFYSVTINDDVTSEELLWLAGDYGHEESCYVPRDHDEDVCTITYRHHERCAIYGLSGKEYVAEGGTLSDQTCDCIPSVIHDSQCPALIGTIDGSCGHTELKDGLGGFNIRVQGAVVQAEEDMTITEAEGYLIGLFS